MAAELPRETRRLYTSRRRIGWVLVLWVGARAFAAPVVPQPPKDAAVSGPTIIEYVIPRQDATPRATAVANDGTVWYTDESNSRIGRVDPKTAEILDFETPTPSSGPRGIAVGRRGRVWFAAAKVGRISVLDPASGEFTEYALPANARDPDSLIVHKARVWFTVQRANFCGYLRPKTGAIQLIPVKTRNARPHGIAAAPDGTIWVTLFGSNRLARINPRNDTIEEIVLPHPGTRPRQLAIDGAGVIWYTDHSRSKLGRYDPARRSFREFSTTDRDSGPAAIAIGGDGRVWYNEGYTNRMVGFDPKSGKSRSLEIPTEGATVRHMVSDLRRATLWLALSTTRRIGRIDLGGLQSKPGPGTRSGTGVAPR